MRKGLLFMAVFALVISLFIVVGCGGNSVTVKTPKGKVQVEGDGSDSITINEGDESATLEQSKKAPTEAQLGVAVYPGAEFDAENSGSVNYSNEGASGYSGTARFLSEDSFSKVVEWYTGKLGAPTSSSSTTAEWIVGVLTSGKYSVVHVEEDDGQTGISITHMDAAVK